MAIVAPRPLLVIAAGALALSSLACDQRAAQTGVQGNLTFYSEPADESSDFDRPLAVGSTMELFMEPADGRQLERVLDVTVDPPNLAQAQVLRDGEPGVSLYGLQSGAINVTPTVSGGGETYTDTARMRVAAVDRVNLHHSCTDAPDGAYLTDRFIRLDMERLDQSGNQLVGFARGSTDPNLGCHLAVSPEGILPDIECDESGLYLPAFRDPGSIYVDVLDNIRTSSHREIDVHLITLGELDFEPNYEDLVVGTTTTIELFPLSLHEGWPVCTHLDMYVYIDTPDTCRGPSNATEFSVPSTDMNQISLRGSRHGICQFAVFVDDMEFIFDAYVD